jgi:hypothetical protein
LLTFLIVGIAFIQGCTSNMSHGTQHKTMREELLGFAHDNHPREDLPDEKVAKIVEKYITVGMSINQVIEIAHKNGVEIRKAFRTKSQINKKVDFYVGSIDHIPAPFNPLIYKEVRIILKTMHDQQIVNEIETHYFIFSRID